MSRAVKNIGHPTLPKAKVVCGVGEKQIVGGVALNQCLIRNLNVVL